MAATIKQIVADTWDNTFGRFALLGTVFGGIPFYFLMTVAVSLKG